MKDGLGRKIDYLRISLTDKCNLRCLYCMPSDGVTRVKHDDLLRFEEIVRIAHLLTKLGLKKIRLTGGEPLVRRDVQVLIRMLKEACPNLTIAMTSNGILLDGCANELKEAGLTEINVSLDTLNPETYRKLTGFDGLDKTLAGIAAAKKALLKVKLNCVPIRGVNDKELTALIDHVNKEHLVMRFIELMPIGCGKKYEGISFDTFLKELEAHYGQLHALPRKEEPQGPAVYYRLGNDLGTIGLIRPLSSCFCAECNRLRLTADGDLKLCLYHSDALSLRDLLRSGITDERLLALMKEAISRKPKEHSFGNARLTQDERRMFEIGG